MEGKSAFKPKETFKKPRRLRELNIRIDIKEIMAKRRIGLIWFRIRVIVGPL